MILELIGRMLYHLVRRGRGILKLLFIIDDFFRVFTMTMLFPFVFYVLKFGNVLIVLGAILGFIIDAHDFISEFGIGKIQR